MAKRAVAKCEVAEYEVAEFDVATLPYIRTFLEAHVQYTYHLQCCACLIAFNCYRLSSTRVSQSQEIPFQYAIELKHA